MSDYYDRDLEPIPDYRTPKTKDNGKRVLNTIVGRYRVSTIWLGLDHSFYGGAPLVFETAIFGNRGNASEVAGTRHYTEEEAARYHLAAIDAIRAGHEPGYDDDWMTQSALVHDFEAAWHAVQGDTYADRIYRMGLEAAAQQDPQLLTRLNTLKETK